jgi:hypothetical protein
MLSAFFSYAELDSIKEKIKPKLFINKNEIMDYPNNSFIIIPPKTISTEKKKRIKKRSTKNAKIKKENRTT